MYSFDWIFDQLIFLSSTNIQIETNRVQPIYGESMIDMTFVYQQQGTAGVLHFRTSETIVQSYMAI